MSIHQENKTPSFPFYPKDWLTDLKVKTLTFEEQAVYFNMLCYSWLDDLPCDIESVSRLIGYFNEQVLAKIITKFFEEKNGLLFNKRLEKVKQELVEFRQKKSEAGKKGNAKRWNNKPKTKSSHSDKSANRKPIAKASPPIPSPFPIPSSNSSPDISKDIQAEPEPLENQDIEIINPNESLVVEIEKEKSSAKKESYGNEDINRMLGTIKELLHLSDFKETQKLQRQYGLHLVNLKNKLGKDEFGRRFMELAQDEFHLKNMGSLKYVYNQIKGFVPIKKDTSNIATII